MPAALLQNVTINNGHYSEGSEAECGCKGLGKVSKRSLEEGEVAITWAGS